MNNSQPIKGDLINWDDASWDVYGMNNYSSSYSSLCRKNELIKIPGLWDFKSGIAMCNVLRGQINVITDYLNQESVLLLMNETNCNCGKISQKN